MTEQDIKQWLHLNRYWFNESDQGRVVRCLMIIYDWYHEDTNPGSFMAAVLRNDLMGAMGNADDLNKRALHVYAAFLYNVVPAEYKQKAEGL